MSGLAASGLWSAAEELSATSAAAVPHPTGAPGLAARWLELTAGAQAARLVAGAPRLALLPRGDGGTVVDVPGWKAAEVTGLPIRRFLRRLGYDARGWGLGTNTGAAEEEAELLRQRVVRLAERTGPVALVGWSLGGVLSREVARVEPEAVRLVVTYGTPVVGGPTFTVGAASWGEERCERYARLSAEREEADPIRVPVVAIHSRRDGVVDWRACVDRTTPGVRNVRVTSTHLGLGFDPDVWATVARALAEHPRA